MKKFVVLMLALATVTVAPSAAFAYVGPGLGVGAVTAVLGVVAALLMAIVALAWYPLKRLLRRRKPTATGPQG
ncbi:hypothetical protein [Ruegeria arenilitoris]|uniref:hypothetical protein n=1 Tax=Ruegeria arenilitoris TaxID=1173585 RepID=UPI00147E1688|nr:hypothetical protein [Ruegeria arenilitoris]